MKKSTRVQLISYTVLAAIPITLWVGLWTSAKSGYAADYEANKPEVNASSMNDARNKCFDLVERQSGGGWTCEYYDEVLAWVDHDFNNPMGYWATGRQKGDVFHNYSDYGQYVATQVIPGQNWPEEEGPSFVFNK